VPLARTSSVALVGVTGQVVEVEVDIANGLVGMILVGLPDAALREARDRIRAAIVNSGEQWPQRKITVGLSPASLPKRGSWFDLAKEVGVKRWRSGVTSPRAASATGRPRRSSGVRGYPKTSQARMPLDGACARTILATYTQGPSPASPRARRSRARLSAEARVSG